jgi:hypothetical protein
MWGQRFFATYLIGTIAITLLSLWPRRATRPSRRAPAEPEPAEVAYLNGGPRLAVATSLAALGLLDVVRERPDGLVVVAPAPEDASPLDRAVHAAVAARGRSTSAVARPAPAAIVPAGAGGVAATATGAGGVAASAAWPPGRAIVVSRRVAASLGRHPAVAAALADVRGALLAVGWLRPEGQRRRARVGAVLLSAVTVVGLVALVHWGAELREQQATASAAMAAMILAAISRATPAGRAAVRAAERRHIDVRSTLDRSWTSPDLRGAVMTAALYRPETLRTVRPVADVARWPARRLRPTWFPGGPAGRRLRERARRLRLRRRPPRP